MPKEIKIGVTGHRNLENEDLLKETVIRILANILHHENGEEGETLITVYSPIAEGADRLVAREVLKYKNAQLIVVLPFGEEHYLRDFGNNDSKEAFNELLQKAASIIHTGQIKEETDSEKRNLLYKGAGTYVVDHADYLIAIWNEKPAKGVGGTAEIIDYAIQKKKPVMVINPEQPQVIKAKYLIESRHQFPLKDFNPAKAHILVEKISPGNILQYRDPYFISYLLKEYDRADKLAMANQRIYRRSWNRVILLGILAVFFVAVAISFEVPDWLSVLCFTLELLLIAYMIFLIKRNKKNNVHEKYLSHRYIAERIRIYKLYYLLGFRMPELPVGPHYQSLMSKEAQNFLDDLAHYTNLMENNGIPLDTKKDLFLKLLIQDQSKYHKGRFNKLSKYNVPFEYFNNYFLLGGIVAAAILHIGLGILHIQTGTPQTALMHLFHNLATFIALFFPALFAGAEGLKYLNEWKRLSVQSKNMIVYFEGLEEKVKMAREEGELKQLVDEVNVNMMYENLDWRMLMADRILRPQL